MTRWIERFTWGCKSDSLDSGREIFYELVKTYNWVREKEVLELDGDFRRRQTTIENFLSELRAVLSRNCHEAIGMERR